MREDFCSILRCLQNMGLEEEIAYIACPQTVGFHVLVS